MLSGIDISHHQLPASLNWPTIATSQSFSIARATYGATPDRLFDSHFRSARDAGMVAGGYHFFRPLKDSSGGTTATWSEQMDAFCSALDGVGHGSGCMFPALDVEGNERYDGDMKPDRYADQVMACADFLIKRYGGVLMYVTQRDWRRIGNPEWLTRPECKLWSAHYTKAENPATPFGMPWVIWQYSGTGRVFGAGEQDIDVNRFAGERDDLPTIPKPEAEPIDRDRVMSQVASTLAGQVEEFFDDDERTQTIPSPPPTERDPA